MISAATIVRLVIEGFLFVTMMVALGDTIRYRPLILRVSKSSSKGSGGGLQSNSSHIESGL
jgi:hypothetical protein